MCKIQGKTVCTCGLSEVGSTVNNSSNNANTRSVGGGGGGGGLLGKASSGSLFSGIGGGGSAWRSAPSSERPHVTSLPLDLASPVTHDPAAPITKAPTTLDPCAPPSAETVPTPPPSSAEEKTKKQKGDRGGTSPTRSDRLPGPPAGRIRGGAGGADKSNGLPTTTASKGKGAPLSLKESTRPSTPPPPPIPHSIYRKRKEHADGKEGGEHDPKVIRSTKEVVGDLDSIRPKMPAYEKDFLSSPADSLESPDDDFPSLLDDDDEDDAGTRSLEESSCVSAHDNWETGGESETRGETQGDEDHDTHEERRLKERSFPRTFPQSSRRTRRRTKKRHHSHSPQDGGMRCQSSEEEEKTPSYLTSLTSEDEEPTPFDPIPQDVTPCQPPPMTMKAAQEPSLVLSELLDANEPVTSDRAWGMRGDRSIVDMSHRTAPRYSRFDDEPTMQSSWYRSDDDDVMVSPRSSQAFIDTTGAPPGPGDHSPPPGQSAVKILMKNINSIKKKIKRYEEEFEAAFGYRPSHSEKMKDKNIKKSMSELSKARKELKQMKDDVAGMMNVPTVFPLSLLRCQESTNPNARTNGSVSCTADTIRQVEDRLKEKRTAVGRPNDLQNMNTTEMQEEKTALQKALLYYESIHGRPSTKEDRDLARPLYDRYRQVKRIVVRTGSRTKENMIELAPILEHEAMDFTLASPQHRGSLQDENERPVSLPPSPPTTPPIFDTSPVFDSPRSTTPSDDPKTGRALGDLHALPISELRERKKEARDEKKKLRRSLREFEENFERAMGRKVQKEDRGPMEQTYLDYKHAKAKLRLLEALLSKHEPQKV